VQIEIVGVFVGGPQPLGPAGLGVMSAIAKRAVTGTRLTLSTINLAGDDQSDRSVHGGPDKAVYAYPSEHLAPWVADLDQPDLVRQHAPFGENVSTRGATESTVCIGDRWTWGDAVLEVCQPRWPCQKLTLHRADARVGALVRSTGRTGWYLRVIEPGTVDVAGPISVDAHAAGVTVHDAHLAMLDRAVDDPERLGRVLDLGALLAEEWRTPLAERLAR
jgi:MOSC domain-containing protein YiiM